ncbi:hypothetical protein GXW78_19145 [Roseomonas terrae]|jgi:hypothetical protein|uniref:Uncharacterized protein n=1 Tax=Neoroseomonas terrae TaxID=424799 RepID=A0ABS5EL86_9PROT|nr:hypothetical protein [Neoroseomonas terrae]MBR0651794.1 hypothetical protein [Neoroseomonas terrae]
MTSLLLAPALSPDAIVWLAAMTAAVAGTVLHAAFPPTDPAVSEALLRAAFHP